jgi:tetratricopeptide (TPR) repeat protein
MTHVLPESQARLARGSAASTRLEPMPRQTFMQHGAMLAPRPPLVAYREDIARRGGQDGFGTSDATWLSVATILSHAVAAPADGHTFLFSQLREVIGSDPALRDVLAVLEHEPPPQFELDSVSPLVRAIVGHMENAGALSLAYSTLTILADADLRLSIIERGRVLAHLGRVAWKAGALETAREHYRRTEVLGRAARNAELRVRAWVGYSIVARLRGNYPEVRKWATRAVHEADRAGLTALGSLAYHSLMVSAGTAGDFNAALVYGWHAFQDAAGDPEREAEMLLNLSAVLFHTGHADVALRGFDAALTRRPAARLALPALGGLALAAAVLGDAARVGAAWTEAERLIATGGLPYHSADALLELSQALSTIGDSAGAAECRARALDIAQRHAFHELIHRLESLRIAPKPRQAEAPHALNSNATSVARAVASLALAGSEANGDDG